MKKTTHKLALHKTTIRNLTSSSLHRVRGGGDDNGDTVLDTAETIKALTDKQAPFTHTIPVTTGK